MRHRQRNVYKKNKDMPIEIKGEEKLPGFFPRAPKECARPAQAFFECFTAAAVKKDESDTTAGTVGLAVCSSELKYYEKCMLRGATAKKTDSKLFRVQEEYRRQKVDTSGGKA